MIGYSHGVDWHAAGTGVRRKIQKDVDLMIWGDVALMMIDDLVNPLAQCDLTDRDRVTRWWREHLARTLAPALTCGNGPQPTQGW